MTNYIIKMPNRYYQGDYVLNNLRNYTKYLGDNCVIVISKNGYDRFYEILTAALKECNIEFITIDPNTGIYTELGTYGSSIDTLEFIIGVGGGTVIDQAKLFANTLSLPCVIIPTVLSSDAACNSIIVPRKYDNKDTMIIRAKRNPEIVIADTKLLSDTPIRYLKSGIGDALSTMFEACSCSEANGITMTHGDTPEVFVSMSKSLYSRLVRHSEGAINYINKTIDDAEDFNLLVTMILFESSILSENCGLAVPHAFSLAYDEILPDNKFLHGEKVSFGILLHLVIQRNFKMLKEVIDFLKSVGLPYNLKSLNLDRYIVLMKICESIATNKVSANTIRGLIPIEIYNAALEVDSFSN